MPYTQTTDDAIAWARRFVAGEKCNPDTTRFWVALLLKAAEQHSPSYTPERLNNDELHSLARTARGAQ